MATGLQAWRWRRLLAARGTLLAFPEARETASLATAGTGVLVGPCAHVADAVHRPQAPAVPHPHARPPQRLFRPLRHRRDHGQMGHGSPPPITRGATAASSHKG